MPESARSPRKPTKTPTRGHARGRGKDWYAPFLAEIARSMNIREASRVANIDHTTAYKRRETDRAFAKAWDKALSDACDAAEAELYRRGVLGIEKPVTVAQQREVITEYSDTLLMFMLKAHREKYRDKQQVTGPNDGPVLIRVVYDEPKEASA